MGELALMLRSMQGRKTRAQSDLDDRREWLEAFSPGPALKSHAAPRAGGLGRGARGDHLSIFSEMLLQKQLQDMEG